MTQETQEPQESQSNNPLVGVKVVVTIFEDGALIGVSRGPVDPHLENCAISPNDDIQAILAVVPGVLERARARWEGTPRFPAYQAPPASAATQRTGQGATRRQGSGGQQQTGENVQTPRMF